MAALTNPGSIFSLTKREDAAGRLYLELWVSSAESPFRGVTSADISVKFDPLDAYFRSNGFKIASYWEGLAYVAPVPATSLSVISSVLVNADSVDSTEQRKGAASVNEIQNISLPSAVSGKFKLRFSVPSLVSSIETAEMPLTATSADIQTAANAALTTRGTVSVAALDANRNFSLTFSGAMGGIDVAPASALIYPDPVQTSGKQLLATFEMGTQIGAASLSPIEVKVSSFTDTADNYYSNSGAGYVISSSPLPLSQFAWVTGGTSSKSANTLDAGTSLSALALGYDGDDTATNLSSGDTFIGGPGTDIATLAGTGSLGVKLLDYELTQRIRTAASVTPTATGMVPVSDSTPIQGGQALNIQPTIGQPLTGQPIFAVQLGSADPVFVEAETVRLSTTLGDNPALMLSAATRGEGGIVRLVGSAFASAAAYSTVASAIAASNNGDLILVADNHVESSAASITIARNDLRIVLLNSTAPAFNFVLAENSTVLKLTLAGEGKANIFGNSYNNLLVGNNADNTIDGGGGNDSLIGAGGDDLLMGGAGNDWLDGSAGWDTAMGGSGDDTLFADEGGTVVDPTRSDLLSGGSGADLLIAGASVDAQSVRMLGGSGADKFRVASLEGIDGQASALPLRVKAFIADLGLADGLDVSALRTQSTGGVALTSSTLSPSVPSAPDLSFALDTRFVTGVTPAGGAGTAPVIALSSDSAIVVSTNSAITDIGVAVTSWLSASDAMSTGTTGQSMQALATSVGPGYSSLESFYNNLYYHLPSA